MKKSNTLVSGTVWTTISTITTSVVQLLRLAILARLLAKADFGLVAILTLVLGVSQALSDLGFSSAIMHKKEISQKEFSSLYWIQFAIFGLFYLVVLFISPLVAGFYNEPLLVSLLPITMLDILFQGFGKLYDVLAQKNFQFKLLAIRSIISAIISLLIAVVMAYRGYGVYSLVISTLAHTLILQVWNFFVGQRYIKLCIYVSIKPVIPLIRIGLYQTGTQILDYLSSKIDILLLGKFLGTESLGVYNLAKELILKVVAIVNSIANRVILPFFAVMQDDNAKMRQSYCRLLSMLSYINFPICAGVGALSAIIVPILYGNNYVELVPLVTIFSFWGMFVCIGNPVGNIVTAKGRTDLSFVYTIVRLFIHIPVTIVLAPMGLNVLAIGMVTMTVLLFFVAWYLELNKTIGLSLKDYLSAFYKNLVLASCIVIAGYFFVQCDLLHWGSLILKLVAYAILIFTMYAALVYMFDRHRFWTMCKTVITVIRK